MTENGRLEGGLLVTVQGDMQLVPRAAAAYRDWLAAARRANTNISIPRDGAYRDTVLQALMYANRLRYRGKVIARPGTSPHGFGNCVDIIGDLDWAIDTAATFGFFRPIRSDVNHFQHNGSTRPTGTPTATPIKEKNMVVKISAPYRGSAIVGAGYFRSLSGANNGEEVAAADMIVSSSIDVTTARFDTIRDICTSNNGITGRTLTSSDLTALDGTLDDEFATIATQNISILSAIAGVVGGGGSGDPALTLTAVRELIAGVNANIDNQPTHFTISPQ